MSLMEKIKGILFEEEEYTEQIKVTPEEKKEEIAAVPPRVESVKIEEKKESFTPMPEVKSEREIFKSENNTFSFPDFDEEEFASSIKRVSDNTNVLDYERKKVPEKRVERNDYSRRERSEVRETRDRSDYSDKKKFKPSPIISPVYGILNQDYKAEDIIKKEKDSSTIDIEMVRKKAFEPQEVKEEVVAPKHEEIDEPVVTFFEEKEMDKSREDANGYKSIDDLLESASTVVNLDDTIDVLPTSNLDAIEEELEKLDTKEEVKENEKNLDDTLDNDLYELIDSMYEEREGE